MNTNRWLTAATLSLTALIALGCRSDKAASNEAKPPEPKDKAASKSDANPNLLRLSDESAKLANLKYAEVIEQSLAAPLEATGRVVINEDRSVRVGSLFTGRIIETPAKVGDHVRQGQPLAKMHTHEVHEAQAEYAKAQAELAERKTRAVFAKSLVERAERLYQAKALSLNELDKARVEDDAAKQEIARAEAELERAIGHREHLGLPDNLNYDEPVVIRAPSAGVIIKREITPGASVNPGDNLFFISDLSSVWVIAEVAEKSLSSLKAGAPVQVKVAAYGEQQFPGRIARIGEALNPQTRTVEVRCLVENHAGKLKPEMFAAVSLAVGEKRDALLVDQTALQEMDGQTVVFVVRGAHEEGQFEKRPIKTGRKSGGLIEVSSGLARGERVVTAGSFQLKSQFSKDKLAEDG